MVKKLGNSMKQPLSFGLIVALILLVCSCLPPSAQTAHRQADTSSARLDETDPLGANAACYVCHMTFVKEELSKIHLQAEVTCIRCHGLSAAHANDENIGATPPDVSFNRDQVNAMCIKCHESHDVPAEQIVARWLQRCPGKSVPVCTDCHGTHKLNKLAEKDHTIKAVLWVGGHSHDFEAIAKITADFLPRLFPVEVEIARDGSFLDSPKAGQIDVILMNHCYDSAEGVLNDRQKQSLLELVHNGTGVVAIHASYYSFVKWDEYHDKFFGARFTKHGKVDVILEVTTVDKKHPVTKNLDNSFEVHSELYQSTPVPKDCCILACSEEEGQPQRHPSVWTRTYGRGRIVTILPAHWPDAYRVNSFQKLIAASTLWAAHKE